MENEGANEGRPGETWNLTPWRCILPAKKTGNEWRREAKESEGVSSCLLPLAVVVGVSELAPQEAQGWRRLAVAEDDTRPGGKSL